MLDKNGKISSLGMQMQTAWVIPDMEAALQFWLRQAIGPFVLLENGMTEDKVFMHRGQPSDHRGQPSDVQMPLALTYVGESQIEVICRTNSAPSVYTEFLARRGQRIHHVSFWPEDIEAAAAELLAAGAVEIGPFWQAM